MLDHSDQHPDLPSTPVPTSGGVGKLKSVLLSIIDSKAFIPFIVLCLILWVALFLYQTRSAVQGFFAAKPSIVLINESLLFQTMEHAIPRKDLEHGAILKADAAYISHLLNTTIAHYQKLGIPVVLSKGVIIVPIEDDITPALRLRILKHFGAAAGRHVQD